MIIGKTNGGVSKHAVSRLINQYKFNGSQGEARKLLRSCRGIGDKNDVVTISSKGLKKLGILKSQLETWNIPDGELIATIIDGTVTSVLEKDGYRK